MACNRVIARLPGAHETLTMTATFPHAVRAPHPLRPVVLGGVIAGALDLVYICTLWAARGVSPVRILQSVAAGWVGRDAAMQGGLATATLGLFSHFGIAVVMACVYYAASRRWPILREQPVRHGALYGVLLYVVMTYVVVPLSAAGGNGVAWQWINLAHIAAHVLLVGIPCALAARIATQRTTAPA